MTCRRHYRRIRKVFAICTVLVVAGIIYALCVNEYVIHHTRERIISIETAAELTDIDCILVLGAAVKQDGTPSNMLYDRIMTGVMLYNEGASPKIIMSGDHGSDNYDEVNPMKNYAMNEGVLSEDIFMDHAGFSTYESIYRAKEVFQAKRILIVSQEYHLYRALYIAEQLGLDAYGVSADLRTYSGQAKRDIREILARNKDFILAFIKPLPTYLGTAIPVSGSGDVTND